MGYSSWGRKESDVTERLTHKWNKSGKVEQVWKRCCAMSPNVLRAERKLGLDFLLVPSAFSTSFWSTCPSDSMGVGWSRPSRAL